MHLSSSEPEGAMKNNDQVYRWMTPCPQTIHADATLFDALATMRRHGIRHLPVMDKGLLVGVLSERDIAFAERFLEARSAPVAAVMTRDPYVTVPYAPLAEVAEAMARYKYGAAIVLDHGNVVGIFTTVDALRALSAPRAPASGASEASTN
jgi:acetoin utilization protein AcuB